MSDAAKSTNVGNELDSPSQVLNAKSTSSPALAWFNGRVFLAHKGAAGPKIEDNNIYTTTFDGRKWSPEAIVQVQPASPNAPLRNAATDAPPALAVFGKRLFLAYKGIAQSKSDANWIHYTSTLDGVTWSPEATVLEGKLTTARSPALAALGDQLFLVCRGAGKDTHISYTSTSDGTSWAFAPWILDGKATTAEAPALAAFGQKLFLAHKGESNDLIHYTTYTPGIKGAKWEPERTIAGESMLGTPGLAAGRRGGKDFVFLAYARSDRSVYAQQFMETDSGNPWGSPIKCASDTAWSPACAVVDLTAGSNAIGMAYVSHGPTTDDIFYDQLSIK